MKRQFVAATIGMGMAAFACSAAFAADKMSAGDRTTDMRVKCEQMTGNDRLACLDSVNKRDKNVGGGPMGATGNTMGRTGDPAAQQGNPVTKEQRSAEARDAITNPALKCADLTGTDRLACNDQIKQRDKTTGAGPMSTGTQGTQDAPGITKEQARSEGRNATTDPKQKCDDLTGTDRLACNDQVKKSNEPRR